LRRAIAASAAAVAFALMSAACAALDDDAAPADGAPPPRAAAPSVLPSPVPSPPRTPSPSATPAIAPEQFCSVAVLTVVDWDLPSALSDSQQRGRLALQYRLPEGAEVVLLWAGVSIEPGSVTIDEITRADPTSAGLFPNADPRGVVPAVVSSDGFDLVADGQLHTVDIGVTLLSEQQFDGSAPWRWSRIADPPFEVGSPLVSARFRVSGMRIDMDGAACTPRFIPLP
jgi:hypothetical protein